MNNKTPQRPSTQLISNRGVLTMLNPVVRKKSKQKSIPIPPEWDPSTAQAYRLLTGPEIYNYLPEDSGRSEQVQIKSKAPSKEALKRKKILSNLAPSRLNTPCEPTQISVKEIDACNLPDDLLIQILPPDQPKNFSLITKPIPKTHSKKIQKSTRPSTAIAPLSSLDLSEIQSNDTNRTPSELHSTFIKEPFKNIDKITSEENEQKENVEKSEEQSISVHATFIKKPVLIRVNSTERQMLRKNKKMRTIFYILRCWANYSKNARAKATFINEVNQSRILFHIITQWHRYIIIKKNLRFKKQDLINKQKFNFIKIRFKHWKTKSKKALQLIQMANDYLKASNQAILHKILEEIQKTTHSKRIYKREVKLTFRYLNFDRSLYTRNNIKDVYNKLNKSSSFIEPNFNLIPYYAQKRPKTIIALHHFFIHISKSVIQGWKIILRKGKLDRKHIVQTQKLLEKYIFKEWFEMFRKSFHDRILIDIIMQANKFMQKKIHDEKISATHLEKSIMVQLTRDKGMLKTKLKQFDRLSQNHKEAVIRRNNARDEINLITNLYFKRQEEIQLIGSYKQAIDIERRTREMRCQLAEAFLYHLGRSIRSYDNQIVAQDFCLSFRILSDPIVNKAVGYFYEKKQIKTLLAIAKKQQQSLKTIVHCVKLYHEAFGWKSWRAFITIINTKRSYGLLEKVRRRENILQLFPYFNWVEILPVRAPRPLKEIEEMFKDLPLVSIQRKLAKERMHHVNVRMMLLRRRVLRDFFRAYASYVQETIATRAVLFLFNQRRKTGLLRFGMNTFKTLYYSHSFPDKWGPKELGYEADIQAWLRNFFRTRVKLHKISEDIPCTY